MNEKMSGHLVENYLDKKELEQYQSFNSQLKEITELYSKLGKNYRSEKEINVNLETIQKIIIHNQQMLSTIS